MRAKDELIIVSGGQTGVDRAALDAALALGVDIAGWCPLGRQAEDGRIDDRYPLMETATNEYAERTRANVRDSDATLILSRKKLSEGTKLTIETAREIGRPCLVIDPAEEDPARVADWLREIKPRRLNVAGPRASEDDEIYILTHSFLLRLLTDYRR